MLLLTLLACSEPGPCELNARPRSIDDAVELIGQLPSPVTLECFVQALDRPLGLEATSDVFSAQPAQGVRTPRIFLFPRHSDMSLSVVPDGPARHLLEFGEHHNSGLTIKAELAFPIELPLDPNAAYDKVLTYAGGGATGCQVCHFEEIEVAEGRYASTPLRPPDRTVVPLEVLEDEHAACDPGAEPERCAMFSALLDHGSVHHQPFPDHYPTLTAPY